MAWTKTANIKGEQGVAGTRSTEIFSTILAAN